MLKLTPTGKGSSFTVYSFSSPDSHYVTEEMASSILFVFETGLGVLVRFDSHANAITVCGACAIREGRDLRVPDGFLSYPRSHSAGYDEDWGSPFAMCSIHEVTVSARPSQPDYPRLNRLHHDCRWRTYGETVAGLEACLDSAGWEPLDAVIMASELSEHVNKVKKRLDSDRVRRAYKMPGQPVYR